jgi:hypothetical protein
MAQSHPRFNLQTAISAYLDNILQLPGVKVLLLDDDTLRFITVALSVTELREKEVVKFQLLSDCITKPEDPQLKSFTCVVLVRPMETNKERLKVLLGSRRFAKCELFFTNLTEFRSSPAPGEVALRIAQGILAASAALRVRPFIRYDLAFPSCKTVDELLNNLVGEHGSLFTTPSQSERPVPATILILDRRSDPVTPLLHLFYFASAVHDFIGYDHNVLKFTTTAGPAQLSLDERTLEPLARINTAYLQDAGEEIHRIYNEYIGVLGQTRSADRSNLEAFAEAHLRGNRARVQGALITGLSDIWNHMCREIDQQDGHNLVKLEQKVVSHNVRREVILDAIRDSQSPLSALRLALVYALRHPDATSDLRRVLSAKADWQANEMGYFDTLLRFSDRAKRGPSPYGDIFRGHGLFDKLMIAAGLESRVDYTEYRAPLELILADLRAGKLPEAAYPFVPSRVPQVGNPTRVIVFYIGGVTYEEMRVATESSRSDATWDVVVGGTTLHNGESYLQYELRPFTSAL